MEVRMDCRHCKLQRQQVEVTQAQNRHPKQARARDAPRPALLVARVRQPGNDGGNGLLDVALRFCASAGDLRIVRGASLTGSFPKQHESAGEALERVCSSIDVPRHRCGRSLEDCFEDDEGIKLAQRCLGGRQSGQRRHSICRSTRSSCGTSSGGRSRAARSGSCIGRVGSIGGLRSGGVRGLHLQLLCCTRLHIPPSREHGEVRADGVVEGLGTVLHARQSRRRDARGQDLTHNLTLSE
mmetsp:Transcript_6400/g.25867  ORF Transcript_6400/g.25867 Transcript_6400/m.25867 type:complete len:240 (-) Transcript_6400:2566-3285(-)